MIKFIHKFLLSREYKSVIHSVAVDPIRSGRNIDLNKIANGIEKANKILKKLRKGGKLGVNHDAIATWERIQASLQRHWTNGVIEMETHGNYTFE